MLLRPAGRSVFGRRIRPLAIRLVLYTVVPFLATASPLLVLPVVSLRFGSSAWANIAVGQSVGSAVAIVAELGWGTIGPLRVATKDMAAASAIFRCSFRQRLIVASICVLPLSVGMYFLVDQHRFAVVLAAAAALTLGLAANWLYVGRNKPQMVIFFDSVPRILSALVGATFLYYGAVLEALPAIQLAVSLAISTVPFFWLPHPQQAKERMTFVEHVHKLWSDQGSVLVTRVAGTINLYIPIVVVYGLTGSLHVAQYAAADRLQKMAIAAVAPLSQVLQGWMPAKDASVIRRRIKAGIVMSWAAGLVVAVIFVAATPYIVRVLFAGTVTVPFMICLPLGLSVSMIIISRCTGNIALVLIGAGWITASSAVIGGLLASVGLLVAANLYGVYGVCWTVFFVELFIVVFQTLALRSRMASDAWIYETDYGGDL